MKFSIIIPIYNAEKTIKRCLDSVKNQQYKNFEVLMVNDGSTDQSENICLQFQNIDSRFKYLYQDNKGVSSARNNGINHAQGDYITFLDSDDIYYSTYLISFVKLVNTYPEAGHYWCAFSKYNMVGMQIGIEYRYNKLEDISLLSRCNIMSLHDCCMDGCPWNKLYKRNILNSIRMDPKLSLGEDLLFNWEYLNNNPKQLIVVNNIPQYGYYNMSENSLDSMYRKNLLEIYELLMQKMQNYLDAWGVSEEQWKIYYNTCFYMYEKVLRNTFRKENNKSKKEQYNFNNRIMRCSQFKVIMKQMSCYINPFYRLAFKTGNYGFVTICDYLVKLKKILKIL